MARILIAEDDIDLCTALERLFDRHGYTVTTANEIQTVNAYLETEIYDLVLTDLRLGRASGLDVLRKSKNLHPETEVIIMTAFGTVASAVEAIQNGAFDFITKPFKNEELLFKVNKALEQIDLRNEVRFLRQEIAGRFGFDNIIGASKSMADLKQIISRIAGTDITVLITGESGTGKELFAKVTHHHSTRRNKPFVPINCSAIPEELLESELFGHVKGAFTSAVVNKRGLFADADKGTIFLDEIGELPFPLQAKLLRVLQEREIRPVGGNATQLIDVRVIAATNANLFQRVQAGTFREDLYYRLNVMPIHIPPLRDRNEDIPALTSHILQKISSEYDRGDITVSADALELLLNHDWPGNVRELENTLRRATALCGGTIIKYEDIFFVSPHTGQSAAETKAMIRGRSLEENQKLQILRSLEENSWNYSLTASQLGIGRTTLWRKVRKYDLRQYEHARNKSGVTV